LGPLPRRLRADHGPGLPRARRGGLVGAAARVPLHVPRLAHRLRAGGRRALVCGRRGRRRRRGRPGRHHGPGLHRARRRRRHGRDARRHGDVGRAGGARAHARHEPARGELGPLRAELLRGVRAAGARAGAQAVRAPRARAVARRGGAPAARVGRAVPERLERGPLARARDRRPHREQGERRDPLHGAVQPRPRRARALHGRGRHAAAARARGRAPPHARRDARAGAQDPALRVRAPRRAGEPHGDGARVRRRVGARALRVRGHVRAGVGARARDRGAHDRAHPRDRPPERARRLPRDAGGRAARGV
ncbi:MAG: ABC transporter, fused permease protein, partial [uncultured Solirubrobacteraceae bacterium]